MDILKGRIEAKDPSQKCYIIPIGGSDTTGFYGYMEQFREMISEQSIGETIDDICLATGSGGTMSSLAISNFLTGHKFNIHAFCVCDNREYFTNHLKDQFGELFGTDTEFNADRMVNIGKFKS